MESVESVCQLSAEFDGAMCHFMETKVLPAHLVNTRVLYIETGPKQILLTI